MRNNTWKKFLAITLALMMATSLGLSSGTLHARAEGGVSVENETVTIEGNVEYAEAFAREDEVTELTVNGDVVSESNLDLFVSASDNGSVTVKTGDVTVPGDGGVEIFTHGEEATADVTVGDVTSGGTAIITSNAGGEIDLETGAVSAETAGARIYTDTDYVSEKTTAEAFAAAVSGDPYDVRTFEGPEAGEDVYAIKCEVFRPENEPGTEYCHYFYSDGTESFEKWSWKALPGSTEINIGGNVAVVGTKDNQYVTGITADVSYSDQAATVVVEGGVSVDNQGAYGSAGGIHVSTDNYNSEEAGTASVVVEEDLTVTSEGSASGLEIRAGDGNASVQVGDVTVDGQSGSGAAVTVEDGQANLAAGDISVSVDETWGTGLSVSVYGEGNAAVKTEDVTYVASEENAGGRAVSVTVNDYNDETFAGGSVTLDAGDISSNAEGLRIDNDDGTADITVGDVDAANTAVYIETSEDTTTDFTAGAIQSDEGTGVLVYTYGGESTVETGAVTAEDNGVYVNVNDVSNTEEMTAEDFAAIDTSTIKDSWTSTFSTPPSVGPNSRYRTKMEVLKAENGTTYYHYFYNDGSETYSKNWYEPTTGFVTAEVNGDITVNGADNSWDYGVTTTVNSNKQAAAVKVDGNVTVESIGAQSSAEGIHAYISDEKTGSVSVTASGDVSVSAENNAYGITVTAEDGTAAASAGDITVSGKYGVGARANAEDGTAILTTEDITVASENWSNALDVDVNNTGSVTAETGDIIFTNTGDYNNGTAVSVYVNSDENAESEKTGSATVTTGNIASDSNGVSISNYYGNADVTVGNVDTVDNAVNVWAFGDSTTTLTAGEVTSDHGTAVEVSTRADDADATVKTGDITFGINPEDHWNSGLYVSAEGAGTATVTAGDVTGTVTEGGTAVREWVSDGGTATVTTGDVTLKVEEDPEEENYYYSTAVNVEAGTSYNDYGEEETSSATANLTTGNVTSDRSGVDINNTASEVNVTVGNIKAQDQGAYVNVSKEGTTSFTAGNITSESSSGVYANNNGGTLNVQTGSVSGKNGISAYANRASDWQWMDEESFEALGLEEPTYIGSWVDDDGTLHSEETWVVDNVEYRRVTTVYSEEEWTDYEKITYTDVEGTTDVVVKGDVSASNTDWANGANLYVSSGKQEGAMAIDGAVTAVSAESGAQAASVGGDSGGEAALLIDGNVSATGKDWTNGVGVSAGSGSTAEAVVHGDISATSTDGFGVGVQLSASDESTVNATVEGDINATGETSDGVETFNNGGTLSLTVVGDITSNDTGIEMNSGNWENEYLEGKIEVDESELTYYSIDKDGNYTWKEYIHKDGDKEIHYDEYGNQWILKTPETEKESVSNIDVIGDVTGTDEAVLINLNGEKAKINMVVDGTLSGEENGVVLKAQTVAENVSLTVWEIKPNEDGAVAARQTNIWTEDAEGKWTTSTVEDEEFEKQIQYIIRVEQPNKGSVDTVGTTDYEGYKVAKEGETVTLKVNVPAGYRLKNAYNGTDTKVQLAKDENGNYYLIIPRGGAVTLSVTLERIPPKQKTDEEITEAVEEAIAQTEPEEATSTKVEVQTDSEGKKTVVLTPAETAPAADETATETAAVTEVAVSSELVTEIQKANVENVAVASKSEAVQVVLQSAAVAKVMKENDSAHLIVDIDEGTKQTEEAAEKVPEGLKTVEGAVYIQVKLVDKEGNSTTLGSNENIKVSLKLDYIEGLQIVYIGKDGAAVTVEPVWVEATDTVPGHWEVPYMGVGSYIPVVPEA